MLKQIFFSLFIFGGFSSVRLNPNEPACGVKGPHPSSSSGDLGIAGGDDAAPYEFPWQGAVLSDDGTKGQLCGGSILNNRWVITAGHCVCKHGSSELKNVSTILFIAGSTTLVGPFDQPPTVRYIEKSFRPPKYHEAKYNSPVNDIGLLKLNESLPLSDPNKHLSPICLPKEHLPNDLDYLAGTVCTTTGWGQKVANGPKSDTLQRVNITIQKQASCARAYAGDEIQIDESMICAADPGKDKCKGDSGGPLICYSDNSWNIVGITSFGIGCADPKYPGVYARVTEFLPWIKETIANN